VSTASTANLTDERGGVCMRLQVKLVHNRPVSLSAEEACWDAGSTQSDEEEQAMLLQNHV
jgi:hypothetical protein